MRKPLRIVDFGSLERMLQMQPKHVETAFDFLSNFGQRFRL